MINTKNGTRQIQDASVVEVDGDAGTVRVIADAERAELARTAGA